ncbi:MAG: DUF4363 family protein [Oscillospiraceae bacterium]|nr:DUF4363 family protein [Oscillospiraceae bacterium]
MPHKELVIGALFAALCAAAILNIHYIRRLTADVTALADRAAEYAQAGEWEGAERAVEDACALWRANDQHTHIVLRHSSIEAADVALNELMGEIYARDSGRVRGAAENVYSALSGIAEIERIRLGSIF